ncbi:MAG: hypothetical protein IPK84_04945 [Candidatus Moraniibacteriota bacterium]|nr:MAG: hypothetical protein IPK84_04945 [Candidatus Moranbacteria bacterium]
MGAHSPPHLVLQQLIFAVTEVVQRCLLAILAVTGPVGHGLAEAIRAVQISRRVFVEAQMARIGLLLLQQQQNFAKLDRQVVSLDLVRGLGVVPGLRAARIKRCLPVPQTVQVCLDTARLLPFTIQTAERIAEMGR